MNEQSVRAAERESFGGRKMTKWAQASREKMEKKGTVGSLTEAAHRAGYDDTMEFARHERDDPDASSKMKKKANWAININK